MFEQKSRLKLLLALVILLPAGGARTAGEGGAEHGLLWRISTPGAGDSYLFGTIHSGDPRVLDLPAALTSALAASRSFSLEVALSAEALTELNQRMLLPPGESLQALLTPTQWQSLREATAGAGLPLATLRRLRPWAVVMLLSAPGEGGRTTLDVDLQRRAIARGLPVYGLESVAEQVEVFEGLTRDEQLRLLVQTLSDWPGIGGYVETLLQAWLARDLAQMVALMREQVAQGDAALNRRFIAALIDGRNRRLLRRMVPRLREGGAFVAVGALHLPGERGLLRLLADSGFALHRIY